MRAVRTLGRKPASRKPNGIQGEPARERAMLTTESAAKNPTLLEQFGVTIAPSHRRRREIDFKGKRVHLIGVGGCGMRGAAGLLNRCGAIVSGSDRASFAGLGALNESGVVVHVGQRATNVPPTADLVVCSAAIPETNVELQTARAHGLRVVKYAELLGELMMLRSGVAVAGTHGKSTTTALCAHLFRVAGLDPSFVIGASSPQLGGSSGVGMGGHFIVEACEFDRSFLHLRPAAAAILNVEADHLDCYAGLDEIVAAFGHFASRVDNDGLIVVAGEDVHAMTSVAGASARVETFGFEEGATWRAIGLRVENGRYAFEVTYEGLRVLETSLVLAGRHNVSNALAATALAWNAGATPEAIAEGIRTFGGVDRRMSLRGRFGGVTVVDDYAHHPTEVRVTLSALRDHYHPGKLWVVFQPHQHSRTRILMDDFARSFVDADEVIIPDIYGSRDTELEIKRTGAHMLVERIQANHKNVTYIPNTMHVAAHLDHYVADGDLVVTMGAGDIWKVADELADRLRRTR